MIVDNKLSAREKRHAKVKKEGWEYNEPKFNPLDYSMSLTQHLNFFNVEVDDKVKKGWVIDYWKSNGFDTRNMSFIHEFYFKQLSVLIRLKDQGFEVSDEHEAFILQCHSDYIKRAKKAAVEAARRASDAKPEIKVSSEEKYTTQARELCAEIDAEIDNIAASGKRTVTPKALVTSSGALPGSCKIIGDYYKKTLDELREAALGKDPSLKEGYSNYNKKTLKILCEFVNETIEISEQTKKLVVTRKRKERPPAEIVKKVQYLLEFPDLGLKSINPVKIVGAEVVYLFNVKVRKLFKYIAVDGMTLSVKGTSLLNFDLAKSSSKTVRKPEDMFGPLADYDTISKRAFGKLFDNIKSVNAKAPGRISGDMIIVRVF